LLRYLVILILLTSCGSASQLKRAKRLIDKATPGAMVVSDTVWQDRVVVIPERRIDTLVSNVDFRDTIFVTRDKVVTKVKVNVMTKEVYVDTKCPEIIKIVKVPTVVNRSISAGYTKAGLIWRASLAFILGVIVGTIFGKPIIKLALKLIALI